MNSVRALLRGDGPLVAVSFGDQDSERAAAEARALGVDVAELRVDQFVRTDAEHVVAQVRAFGELPVLVTVRAAHEGGGWHGTGAERLELFRAVAPLADAVDIELSSQDILADVVALGREHDAVTIVSYHDFDHTPALADLKAVVRDAKEAGADIVKVSTMANSGQDVKRLASLLLETGDQADLIVIAMGATGTVSRVFFPVLGSRLTYSYLGENRTSGQLGFTDTLDLLRRFYPDFDHRKTTAQAANG
ncbi:type I 3-dehydroquinate dehydratase [Amycolatopsis sp. H20-H5]|uniref:type I 3-dehydroquinate dehydratase n=1 Tax=Amycolatopsis sp. H20-H5 TaxID=3046309 RepID=UPI002DB88C75|nr:type I 3-dehydroquinate dehydratase [Amycolatopsis sp. H20-H5]MEC3980985.1 type I 3-dehydroquinate dehydratase [Amycolatopsis sp. H20-H5]